MNYGKKKLITILGPTAVGKTKLAALLAFRFNGEIISADSRQVYTGMDIGTGKDYKDYSINNIKIPVHLIDIISPEKEFNLYLFQKHFHASLKEIYNKNKLPFLVGGTALYINSVLQNYRLNSAGFSTERKTYLETLPEEKLKSILLNLKQTQHNTTDLTEKERIIKAILVAEAENTEIKKVDFNTMVIGVYDDRENLKKKIRKRLRERLNEGMIAEVETLLSSGITHEKLRFFGLEYKFVSLYLQNKINYNDMYQKLASAIIQFSKRQMTWFRKMEREGIKIHWIKNNELTSAETLIKKYLGE